MSPATNLIFVKARLSRYVCICFNSAYHLLYLQWYCHPADLNHNGKGYQRVKFNASWITSSATLVLLKWHISQDLMILGFYIMS